MKIDTLPAMDAITPAGGPIASGQPVSADAGSSARSFPAIAHDAVFGQLGIPQNDDGTLRGGVDASLAQRLLTLKVAPSSD